MAANRPEMHMPSRARLLMRIVDAHPALTPASHFALTWQRGRCCLHGAVGLREGGEEGPGVFPPRQGCMLSPFPPPRPPLLPPKPHTTRTSSKSQSSERRETLHSTRALDWPSRTFPMLSWPRPAPSTGAACEAAVILHQHRGPQTQPRFVCRAQKHPSMTHPSSCSSCWCAHDSGYLSGRRTVRCLSDASQAQTIDSSDAQTIDS